jgi:hypothetical protein
MGGCSLSRLAKSILTSTARDYVTEEERAAAASPFIDRYD